MMDKISLSALILIVGICSLVLIYQVGKNQMLISELQTKIEKLEKTQK
jgi:hypothetical protein